MAGMPRTPVQNLELNGKTLMDRPYTLLEMRDVLRKVLGHDSPMLLMQQLQKTLKEHSDTCLKAIRKAV